MELPAPLDLFQQAEAVTVRKAKIEDRRVIRIRSERGAPLGAQPDKIRDEPRLRESLPENLRNPGLVFDHEEAHLSPKVPPRRT